MAHYIYQNGEDGEYFDCEDDARKSALDAGWQSLSNAIAGDWIIQHESETITVSWSTEDILSIDDSLTVEQANKVLELANRQHDAEIGINWDVLKEHIYYLKSEGVI